MVANTFYSVKSILGDWHASYRQCRKDGVVICLLSCSNWPYTLKIDLPPQ